MELIMNKQTIVFILTASCLMAAPLAAGWGTFGASFLGSTLGTMIGNACCNTYYEPCVTRRVVYYEPCVTREVYYEPPCVREIVVRERRRKPCKRLGARYVKTYNVRPCYREHYIISDDECW